MPPARDELFLADDTNSLLQVLHQALQLLLARLPQLSAGHLVTAIRLRGQQRQKLQQDQL